MVYAITQAKRLTKDKSNTLIMGHNQTLENVLERNKSAVIQGPGPRAGLKLERVEFPAFGPQQPSRTTLRVRRRNRRDWGVP